MRIGVAVVRRFMVWVSWVSDVGYFTGQLPSNGGQFGTAPPRQRKP
ncbi:MAG TPA: hypothetical protein VFX89_02820 [Gammaproteobacteria bacterium]|nr:hypothetical protein [Gammaproteobacteria bacterium]